MRFKQNREKMQSGDLLQAAEVFKGLLQIQMDKPLSFREKGMLDRARHMLVSEISTARNVPEIRAVNMLERALAKAGIASAGCVLDYPGPQPDAIIPVAAHVRRSHVLPQVRYPDWPGCPILPQLRGVAGGAQRVRRRRSARLDASRRRAGPRRPLGG